jgi:hypothetical protein
MEATLVLNCLTADSERNAGVVDGSFITLKGAAMLSSSILLSMDLAGEWGGILTHGLRHVVVFLRWVVVLEA